MGFVNYVKASIDFLLELNLETKTVEEAPLSLEYSKCSSKKIKLLSPASHGSNDLVAELPRYSEEIILEQPSTAIEFRKFN
jgi:hypothetical protein